MGYKKEIFKKLEYIEGKRDIQTRDGFIVTIYRKGEFYSLVNDFLDLSLEDIARVLCQPQDIVVKIYFLLSISKLNYDSILEIINLAYRLR